MKSRSKKLYIQETADVGIWRNKQFAGGTPQIKQRL